MEKRPLYAVDSSFAFFASFLLSQLAVLLFTCLASCVYIFCKIELDGLDVFLSTSYGYLLTALVFDAVLFGVFLFYKKRTNLAVIKKPSANKIILYIWVAVLAFVLVSPLINCLDSLFQFWNLKINTITYDITAVWHGIPVNLFVTMISMVIVPAIVEELLFRGVIFKGLQNYGKAFSIIMSAVMFSVFHMAISQTVYPLIMGLLLGVIMYKEDNILYTITVHMTNNFLSVIFAYFGISLSYNHWTFIVLAILLACAFVVTLLIIAFKNNKQSKYVTFTKNEKLAFYSVLGVMVVINIATNLVSNLT